MELSILTYDPMLIPYREHLERRMVRYEQRRRDLVGDGSLCDFANGHEFFGFHRTADGWVYREWAPGADAVYLVGDMNAWDTLSLPLTPLGNGVFEIYLSGYDALYDGCHVKVMVQNQGRWLSRIPLYIRRVEQDPVTFGWCGVITDEPPHRWRCRHVRPQKSLLIYECHVGMAQEKEGVGTYEEFRTGVLPRIRDLGYNAIQLMAIMEHPYYGSFGYQVSSFFASSSRFGTPNELKALIDEAHSMGIAVLLDVVHSHAASNTEEGIAEFDGTPYQFFHEGERGTHPTWGTRLFDYGKHEVVHFLLSNLKYWMEEFCFDGFRFDGVTSMLYRDHGLGVSFGDYGLYFSDNTDEDAVTYLQLANALIREVYPHAVTVAEDMSAMPGMCIPIAEGGIGFDYRLAMGIPDLWIRLLRTKRDEEWSMWQIYGELSGRRPHEPYVGYAESHDQALVGDKTLMFRLCDSEMYTAMARNVKSLIIDRGMALHNMLRLISLTLGGEAYLNFMGNEFGHPEWIDFPREGNGWSHFYCRRQWHLADNGYLRYGLLRDFDKAMLALVKRTHLLGRTPHALAIDEEKQVLIYERGGVVFAFNFSPTNSYEAYEVTFPSSGKYRVTLTTDEGCFGGFDRVDTAYVYTARKYADGQYHAPIYLPARTAVCLQRERPRKR